MRLLLHSLLRMALLLGYLAGCASGRAQTPGFHIWQVTHDSRLTGYLTALEATRGKLEANIAAQKVAQNLLLTSAISQESYAALRAYAKFLRLVRTIRNVKYAFKNMDFRGREWALIPQIKVLAPTEIGVDPEGRPIVGDKEMLSLSLVPPELQTDWRDFMFPADDFLAGAGGGGGSRITLDLPYWSDIGAAFQGFDPSPLTDDVFGTEALGDVMAHSYEALLSAAARIAGWGMRVNTQVLQDTGEILMEGRASPTQLKLQASLYEREATSILNTILRLYIDHGMSINKAVELVKPEVDYWQGFGDKVMTDQSAKIAFAMNLQHEVNQVIGRLEALERRQQSGEVDDKLRHLGQAKSVDGIIDPANPSIWKPMGLQVLNFWDAVDKMFGLNPHGDAIKLQAKGLASLYVHDQFEEAQGLRNIVAALQRMDASLEGVKQIQESSQEINTLRAQTGHLDFIAERIREQRAIRQKMTDLGWGAF